MPADPRLKAQVELILQSHHPDAAAFPDNWEAAGDVDYLYRKHTILVRERDEARVMEALVQILYGRPMEEVPEDVRRIDIRHSGGVVRIEYQPPQDKALTVPAVLDALDQRQDVGPGKATPNHMVYVCPHPCPATEPGEVPLGTSNPLPLPGAGAPCGLPGHGIPRPGCDGAGVSVSLLDTGLLPGAPDDHYWLAGVDGAPEDPIDPGTGNIRPYAGHGTFAAGCLRVAAPKASIFIEQAFDIAAARFEWDLLPVLEDAVDRNPDILVFTFTSSTRQDRSLVTFDDFYERRIREVKGLVVVVPAGNDGEPRWMWPAASPWAVSVGALSASWQERARFSNYGGWVDVYAPGEDLVNAYASGTFVCNEPPVGEHRQFQAMARWSGTSFSTPIVAGLIAARMSATGENGKEAARSLLRLAHSQAIPGVGAVLYPGQACCDPGHCCRGAGQMSPPCECGGSSGQHKPGCGGGGRRPW